MDVLRINQVGAVAPQKDGQRGLKKSEGVTGYINRTVLKVELTVIAVAFQKHDLVEGEF